MVSPKFEFGLTVSDFEEIGVKLLSGLHPFYAAFKAMKDSCLELKNKGTTQPAVNVEDIFKMLKLKVWAERAKKYQGFDR
jgi:2-methylisocitrate lyase-like PEP mutase family enzyme